MARSCTSTPYEIVRQYSDTIGKPRRSASIPATSSSNGYALPLEKPQVGEDRIVNPRHHSRVHAGQAAHRVTRFASPRPSAGRDKSEFIAPLCQQRYSAGCSRRTPTRTRATAREELLRHEAFISRTQRCGALPALPRH
jgi:hypothetical protein